MHAGRMKRAPAGSPGPEAPEAAARPDHAADHDSRGSASSRRRPAKTDCRARARRATARRVRGGAKGSQARSQRHEEGAARGAKKARAQHQPNARPLAEHVLAAPATGSSVSNASRLQRRGASEEEAAHLRLVHLHGSLVASSTRCSREPHLDRLGGALGVESGSGCGRLRTVPAPRQRAAHDVGGGARQRRRRPRPRRGCAAARAPLRRLRSAVADGPQAALPRPVREGLGVARAVRRARPPHVESEK